MEQNYSNHKQFVPGYHYVIIPLAMLLLGGSISALIRADASARYSASLLVLVAFILNGILWYARVFALRAQDRAIRAEENFRHFLLTGKPHDSRLRMGQIIALRFASDAEMPELARRAAEEKLTGKQIKEAIRQWRADRYRV
ncbi:MAG: hypothetical protein RJA57_428 [Bacteroidota bacterium]|jgi:hypothetical protein